MVTIYAYIESLSLIIKTDVIALSLRSPFDAKTTQINVLSSLSCFVLLVANVGHTAWFLPLNNRR